MSNSPRMDRRSFLKHAGTAGVAAPFFIRNLISAPPSDTVRLASFGAGNMAFVTLDMLCTHPKVKLTCVAEVDSTLTEQLNRKYPNTKVYEDWRQMLDKERKNLDAVCVGTPDHMHAPNAMSAMQVGLHTYIQKPLAQNLYEVRQLTTFARKHKLVTQMGIQVHSRKEYLTAVELVHSGAIGKVKEVYSWSEKKWGDLEKYPDRVDPVPPNFKWDLWLGVAEPVPFVSGFYHPLNWRKRTHFGTATFGDMGCHILDPVFSALQLTAPISVRSEGPAPSEHSWAVNSIIHYTFPGTAMTEGKTVNLHWYDGDERPPKQILELLGSRRVPGQGSILIGTKGLMLLPHSAIPTLLPEEQYQGFAMPQLETVSHYHQFVDAVLGKGKTSTPLDYAGPLTETVLLGPMATRFPNTTLEWNAKKLQFRNSAEANSHIRRQYRAGWKIKGLS